MDQKGRSCHCQKSRWSNSARSSTTECRDMQMALFISQLGLCKVNFYLTQFLTDSELFQGRFISTIIEQCFIMFFQCNWWTVRQPLWKYNFSQTWRGFIPSLFKLPLAVKVETRDGGSVNFIAPLFESAVSLGPFRVMLMTPNRRNATVLVCSKRQGQGW